jgi:hypothetical protein
MLIATCSVRRRVMVGGRNCTGRRTRKAEAHRARTHPRVHLTPSVQYKHVHWLSEQCVRCCVPEHRRIYICVSYIYSASAHGQSVDAA